jgi:hypothetical protein
VAAVRWFVVEGRIEVKVSDGEKLILLMLSEIYAKLDIDGAIDPGFVKSAILRDHLWSIPWKYPGLPFEGQKMPKLVKEVIDILDMWSLIETSHRALSEAAKAKLAEDIVPFGHNPKFHGFDGGTEAKHVSVASFLINDLGIYEEFRDRSMNSHIARLETYQRMLSVFESVRGNVSSGVLGYAELKAVLKEMLYH